jgi:hypothetical protein
VRAREPNTGNPLPSGAPQTQAETAPRGPSPLADALELPLGRWLLLEPDRRFVAFGPHVAEGGHGIGAIITPYALADTADHRADARRVFASLAAQRAARSLALLEPRGAAGRPRARPTDPRASAPAKRATFLTHNVS